jgi:hypothetical protein
MMNLQNNPPQSFNRFNLTISLKKKNLETVRSIVRLAKTITLKELILPGKEEEDLGAIVSILYETNGSHFLTLFIHLKTTNMVYKTHRADSVYLKFKPLVYHKNVDQYMVKAVSEVDQYTGLLEPLATNQFLLVDPYPQGLVPLDVLKYSQGQNTVYFAALYYTNAVQVAQLKKKLHELTKKNEDNLREGQ